MPSCGPRDCVVGFHTAGACRDAERPTPSTARRRRRYAGGDRSVLDLSVTAEMRRVARRTGQTVWVRHGMQRRPSGRLRGLPTMDIAGSRSESRACRANYLMMRFVRSCFIETRSPGLPPGRRHERAALKRLPEPPRLIELIDQPRTLDPGRAVTKPTCAERRLARRNGLHQRAAPNRQVLTTGRRPAISAPRARAKRGCEPPRAKSRVCSRLR